MGAALLRLVESPPPLSNLTPEGVDSARTRGLPQPDRGGGNPQTMRDQTVLFVDFKRTEWAGRVATFRSIPPEVEPIVAKPVARETWTSLSSPTTPNPDGIHLRIPELALGMVGARICPRSAANRNPT